MRTIAATLGIDLSEMRDYRYQPSRSSVAIYAIGDNYYCARTSAPDDGRNWEKYKDQFWAERHKTILWVSC